MLTLVKGKIPAHPTLIEDIMKAMVIVDNMSTADIIKRTYKGLAVLSVPVASTDIKMVTIERMTLQKEQGRQRNRKKATLRTRDRQKIHYHVRSTISAALCSTQNAHLDMILQCLKSRLFHFCLLPPLSFI
jgi:hypothetical protein